MTFLADMGKFEWQAAASLEAVIVGVENPDGATILTFRWGLPRIRSRQYLPDTEKDSGWSRKREDGGNAAVT
jgi:hypothetical protein